MPDSSSTNSRLRSAGWVMSLRIMSPIDAVVVDAAHRQQQEEQAEQHEECGIAAIQQTHVEILEMVERRDEMPGRVFRRRADVGQPQTDQHRQCADGGDDRLDRKSTRLNSSHQKISYAVFCLKKKKRK